MAVCFAPHAVHQRGLHPHFLPRTHRGVHLIPARYAHYRSTHRRPSAGRSPKVHPCLQRHYVGDMERAYHVVGGHRYRLAPTLAARAPCQSRWTLLRGYPLASVPRIRTMAGLWRGARISAQGECKSRRACATPRRRKWQCEHSEC